MRTTPGAKAFTIIELLVGLLITSILLAAVATVAFALSSATRAGDETHVTQAQLRQVTVRLSELIGKCKLICTAPGDDLVVWREDDNGDRQINLQEIVYLERGPNHDMLRLCAFTWADNPPLALSDLSNAATKSQLISLAEETYASLLPLCQGVEFAFYPIPPPVTKTECLKISFTLAEQGSNHRYEIVTALRSRAGHLLNEAGDALVATDDD